VRRLCSPRTANLLPGAKKCEAESLSTAVATLYLTNNDQLWDPSKNIGECIAYQRSPGVDNVQYIWLIKPGTPDERPCKYILTNGKTFELSHFRANSANMEEEQTWDCPQKSCSLKIDMMLGNILTP